MSPTDKLRAALFGDPPQAGFKPSPEGTLAAFTELNVIVAAIIADGGDPTEALALIQEAMDSTNAAADDALAAAGFDTRAAAITFAPKMATGEQTTVYGEAANATRAAVAGEYRLDNTAATVGEQIPLNGRYTKQTSGTPALLRTSSLDGQVANAAAAALPTSNALNLAYDPFFKRLRAAYPTPATTMLLNGLRRVVSSPAPTWEATDNAYGGRGVVLSATGDFFIWISEYGVVPGDQINEVVRVNIPSGTTWTIQPTIQDAAATSNLVVGATVTVPGTGAVQEIPLAGLATPTSGLGALIKLRIVRTVGTGTCTVIAQNMFQGAQRRPISKVDLLGTVSDTAVAVAALPVIQAAVSAYQPQAVTTVDGSYINSGGAITAGGPTNRYAQIAIPAAPPRVRITSILPPQSGYWLATYYSDEACTVYLGHEVQGAGGGDVPYTNYGLTLPAGTRGLRVNGRTTAPIVVDFFLPVVDLAQRVLDGPTVVTGFSGKAWASYGDSITAQGKWQAQLSTYLALGPHTNCGVGGSSVSTAQPANSMSSDTRINAIPANSALIMFMGLTNDWGQNAPMGAITPVGTTSFDTSTAYGGLETVAVKLLARFNTGQLIVWMTPVFGRNQARVEDGAWISPYYNRAQSPADIAAGRTYGQPGFQGLNIADYAEAMRRVALKYGFPVIDLPARLGWNTQNAALYYDAEGTDSTTYIHPNAAKGGPEMAAIMADELGRINRKAALP